MRKLLFSVVAASAMLATAPHADAATIQYELSGVTATLQGVAYDLTGTFTFNTSDITTTLADIALTPVAGGATEYFTEGERSLFSNHVAVFDPTSDTSLILEFVNTLSRAVDDVTAFNIGFGCTFDTSQASCTGGNFNSTAQSGEIDPTPLPPAAPLLASVLGILVLMGHWRKRRDRWDYEDAQRLA